MKRDKSFNIVFLKSKEERAAFDAKNRARVRIFRAKQPKAKIQALNRQYKRKQRTKYADQM